MSNSGGKYTFKGFRQTVKVCKQRLEIFGQSIQKTKKDFLSARKYAITKDEYNFSIDKITFEYYLEEIKFIIKNKIKSHESFHSNFRDSLTSGDLAISGQSYEGILYSIFFNLSDDEIVEYDLTDIIRGGDVSKQEVKIINREKIIVLTEGKIDVEFISKSLSLLYPHLAPYYHFINFDEYKVESSASALVKFIIALGASKVKHPIIALFDNDTTGISEMNRLKTVRLDWNFKILKYPDLKLAKKYPTIGPTGIKKMNINGFACGIEMYFDEETLTKDNKLIPTHWKGFNDRENKYQGEISEKKYVQDKFREKLKSPKGTEFSSMELILKAIFDAYRN